MATTVADRRRSGLHVPMPVFLGGLLACLSLLLLHDRRRNVRSTDRGDVDVGPSLGCTNATDTAPVLVLKTARSGSTWFSELLNELGHHTIDELVKGPRRLATDSDADGRIRPPLMTDNPAAEAARLERAMSAALRCGTSFTVNAKNTPCVSFARTLRGAAPAAPRLLLLERNNVLKHLVSYRRMRQVVEVCGWTDGIKNSSACEPSRRALTRRPLLLPLSELRSDLVCVFTRSVRPDRPLPPIIPSSSYRHGRAWPC